MSFDDIFVGSPAFDGVWAIVVSDYYPYIDRMFPTEIEALRYVNNNDLGTAKFIPWGKALNELEEES